MTGLEALREARLAGARSAASTTLAGARSQAGAIAADGQRRADAVEARARAEGQAEADATVARELATTRRRARALVLAAQRRALEQLRSGAIERARRDDRYPALLEALARHAREQLGEHAVVCVDTDGPGGLIASAGGRRVDYSLPAVVDRCLPGLGPRLGELWR